VPASITCPDIFRKRKSNTSGKEVHLRQAIAVILALKLRHAQMTHLRDDLITRKRARCEPISNRAVADEGNLVPNSSALKTCCSARNAQVEKLHTQAFGLSQMPRCLIPFDLTDTSTVVDCTETFASLFCMERDRLVRSRTLTDVCARSSFVRLRTLIPLVYSFGVLLVQNLPEYLDRVCCDLVISMAVDTVPTLQTCPPLGDRHVETRFIRRFLQIMVVSRRRMDSSVHHQTSTRTTAASSNRVSSLPAGCHRDTHLPHRSADDWKDCSIPGLGRYQCSDALVDAGTQSLNPSVFVVPLLQRPEDTGFANTVGWMSPWRCDGYGHREPHQWTPLSAEEASSVGVLPGPAGWRLPDLGNDSPDDGNVIMSELNRLVNLDVNGHHMGVDVQPTSPTVVFHNLNIDL